MIELIRSLFAMPSEQLSLSFSALCVIAFLLVWTWTTIHFMSGETDIQIRRRK